MKTCVVTRSKLGGYIVAGYIDGEKPLSPRYASGTYNMAMILIDVGPDNITVEEEDNGIQECPDR